MKKLKHMILATIVLGLCLAGSMTAWAAAPDLNALGSITFNLKYEGNPVSGGSFKVFKVAYFVPTENDFDIKWLPEFEGAGADLEKIGNPDQAELLAKSAADQKLEGEIVKADDQGHAVLEGLSTGFYLVVQEEKAAGYEAIKPFVISVPKKDGDSYVYDVDASPKMTTHTTETTPPTTPPTPPKPPVPNTGQYWWPVPVLAFAGIFLFAIGWVRRRNS